ncbi:unnamed protein product [Didymodactylos carnosus]|uniref:G domain-containing protein n=2 Tax=Didymodactylos carnosus TaxID=1234261 RepID=A0A8S2FQ42_9BILA|nr:unnamed protein product [Didymodactylos carnosus]CAF4319518.1 unnamed protein product [Didymodactylos carnosus]
MAWIPVAVGAVGALSHFFGGKSRTTVQYVTNPALEDALKTANNANAHLQKQFADIQQVLKEQQLDSFEKLKAYDHRAANALVELASQTRAMVLEGRTVALFGVTSSGKSTIINKLLNSKVAAVGVGDTTKAIQPFNGNGYCLYDIPGRNDDLSYFTSEYISFWKGLTHRLVTIQSTLREMTKVFSLLDAMDLRYDIVVNKFDLIEDANEAEAFRQQIRNEVHECGLKGVNKIFFVSAKKTDQFPDWIKLVQYLRA